VSVSKERLHYRTNVYCAMQILSSLDEDEVAAARFKNIRSSENKELNLTDKFAEKDNYKGRDKSRGGYYTVDSNHWREFTDLRESRLFVAVPRWPNDNVCQ